MLPGRATPPCLCFDTLMHGDFDFEIRILRCPNCVAPVEVPLEGGQFPCAYCQAPISANARPRPPTHHHVGASRLAPLAVQAANKHKPQGLYDLDTIPAEFEFIKGAQYGEAIRKSLESVWSAYRARLNQQPTQENQHRFFFLTFHLNSCLFYLNDRTARRATLETAWETLPDVGHKHIVATQLVRASAIDGEAAEKWLALADPEPELLWFDTEYRLARCAILEHREGWHDILRLVGQEPGDVPIHHGSLAAVACTRVAAYERLGQPDRAEATMRELLANQPQPGWVRSQFSGRREDEMWPLKKSLWQVYGRVESGARSAPTIRLSFVVIVGIVVIGAIALVTQL